MKEKDPELEVLFEHFEKLVEKERKRKVKKESKETTGDEKKGGRYIKT